MQYIINTSFMVEPKVHGQWYELVTTKLIPLIKELNIGEVKFSRILSEQVERHYIYSLIIETDELINYNRYKHEVLGEYIDVASPMFGDKVTHFVTIMKQIPL